MNNFLTQLKDFLVQLAAALFTRSEDIKQLPMNMPPTNPDALLPWTTFDNCHHNVRALCDLEGLTEQQKNQLSSTVHCESNYNPQCVHPNLVSGKVTSTDYGIAQVNDWFHIGQGKDFPSVQYVLDNPEACIRWMARQWKAGNARLWVCFNKQLFTKYAA